MPEEMPEKELPLPLKVRLLIGLALVALFIWIGFLLVQDLALQPLPAAQERKMRTPTTAEAIFGDPSFEENQNRNPGRDPSLEAEQSEYHKAVQDAQRGYIRYFIPPEIKADESRSVEVRIYGPHTSERQRRGFGATGSGSLKVITPMLVTLSEPDNPGTFDIRALPNLTGDQFLPDDSFAEWVWTVRPLKTAKGSKNLRVSAWMVFNEKLPNGAPMQVQVSSFTVAVLVKVRPRSEQLSDWIDENWKDVLKYLIPTGAGSVFIIWLIAKLAGKSNKPEEKEKEKEMAEEEEDADKEDAV